MTALMRKSSEKRTFKVFMGKFEAVNKFMGALECIELLHCLKDPLGHQETFKKSCWQENCSKIGKNRP